MARKSTLSLPVDAISQRSSRHEDHKSSIGDRLFPDVRNATGHVLDLLARKVR